MLIQESFLKRFIHAVRCAFFTRYRELTPHEVMLVRDNLDLKKRVAELEAKLETADTEIRKLESDVSVKTHEINLLALVHESDRKRWQKLTAKRAEQIARVERQQRG